MKRRALIGLGLMSIGTGALYSTNAFDLVNSNRGVSITTAEIEDGALLEIENITDESTDPVFQNTSALNMGVNIHDDRFSPSEFSLLSESPDNEQPVTIESDEDISNVSVTAELFNGENVENGDRVGEISLQRDFPVETIIFGTDGEIETGGAQGEEITFFINTTEDIEAEITGFGVSANQENVSFNENGSEFDGSESLPVPFNDQIEVTLSEFQGPGGNGNRPSNFTIDNQNFVDPNDADIVVTLELADHDHVELGIEATAE